MDEIDIDCASCAYPIKDYSNAVTVSCGHGVIHRNCAYFNQECSVCDEKLTIDVERKNEISQFRQFLGGDSGQFDKITSSLNELKNMLMEQKQEQRKTSEIIEEMCKQLKAKDETIAGLQQEIYEFKLEKVESLKKELEEKLHMLD